MKTNSIRKSILKFLKFVFDESSVMNYTYSYFAGIMGGISIAVIFGQKPLNLPLHTLIIFFLITFFFGFLGVSVIRFSVTKK